MEIMTIFGTRPEAIKLAPVLRTLAQADGVRSTICVTGQHREMLDQVNELFGIRPDLDLQVMAKGQSLTHITTTVLERLEDVLRERRPDWVVVQGDTTTAFAAAFAAFLQRIPVAHVEAGLRTGNVLSPWPEEMNRHLTACLTECHFAPTPGARTNLLKEGIAPTKIHVTGNTVIDSLLQVRDILVENTALAEQQRNRFDFLDPDRRIILVTGHRRENFDGGLDRVCAALTLLAVREDVQIIYPVHLNPAVQGVVKTKLSGVQHVHLLPPLEYLPFVYLMDRSYLIITDSGGVQEEAPSLGKPVLVTRNTTERPEAVQAGTVRLVGTDPARIVSEATRLLDSPAAYEEMARAHNPYGDGRAAARIAARLLDADPAIEPYTAPSARPRRGRSLLEGFVSGSTMPYPAANGVQLAENGAG